MSEKVAGNLIQRVGHKPILKTTLLYGEEGGVSQSGICFEAELIDNRSILLFNS